MATITCSALRVLLMVALSSLVLGQAQGPERSDNPTLVTYWHSYSGPIAIAHERLLDEFHTAHPDIQVEASYAGDLWTMRDKLLSAVAAGAGPDVASIDQFWIAQLAANGAVVPLAQSDYPMESFGVVDGVSALLDTGRYGGQVWSAPFASSTIVLYVNLTLMRERGLDRSSVPSTWSELIALASSLERDPDGDGRPDVWILDAPTTAQTGVVFNYIVTLWQHGGDVLSADEGQVAFDSPEAASALALWQRLVDSGVLDLVRPQGVWESGRSLFQIGSSARIVAAYQNLPFEFDVAPLPFEHRRVNGVGGRNLAVLATDANKREAAFTFVRYLMSPDVGRRWAEATGYLPLRAASFASAEYQAALEANPRLETAFQELLYARARPNVISYADVSRVLGDAVERALYTGADPRMILSAAAAEAARVVARYERREP